MRITLIAPLKITLYLPRRRCAIVRLTIFRYPICIFPYFAFTILCRFPDSLFPYTICLHFPTRHIVFFYLRYFPIFYSKLPYLFYNICLFTLFCIYAPPDV